MRRLVAAMTALVLTLAVAVGATANVGIDAGTNAVRAKVGLAPLQTSAFLTSLAQQRARQITTDFSHHLPELEAQLPSCWRGVGENIAWIAAPAGSAWAVNAWVNSPEHYANMLGDFDQQGSALLQANGRTYAVQIFLKGCKATTVQPKPQPKPTVRPATQKVKPATVPVTMPDTSIGF